MVEVAAPAGVAKILNNLYFADFEEPYEEDKLRMQRWRWRNLLPDNNSQIEDLL